MTVLLPLTVLADVAYPAEDQVTPGPLGFFTMFALAVAVVLLMLSMVRHMRKIRFSDPDAAPGVDRAQTAAGTAGAPAAPPAGSAD